MRVWPPGAASDFVSPPILQTVLVVEAWHSCPLRSRFVRCARLRWLEGDLVLFLTEEIVAWVEPANELRFHLQGLLR